jgi:hypothetical protein
MVWMVGLAFAADLDLGGQWVMDEPLDRVRVKHEATLQSALSQFPWAIRPLIKRRLAEPIQNCRTLQLSWMNDVFKARCDGKEEFVRTLSDTSPITGEDGKPYTVKLEPAASHLELSFLGEDGGQRTRYLLQGDQLLLTKEIVSSWFEKPVVWTVAYALSKPRTVDRPAP